MNTVGTPVTAANAIVCMDLCQGHEKSAAL